MQQQLNADNVVFNHVKSSNSTWLKLAIDYDAVWSQSESAEYQQADALWELFLELKTAISEQAGPEAGDDDDDEDNSRMSSVTDDTASRDEALQTSDIQVTGVGPKVPVLKLKVGT